VIDLVLAGGLSPPCLHSAHPAIDAETLFSRRTNTPSKLDEAKGYVRDALANGAIESQLLEDGAIARGVAPATFKRAKNEVGVTSKKVGFGKDGKWHVALIKNDHLSALAGVDHVHGDPVDREEGHLITFDDQPDSGPESTTTPKDDQHEGGDGIEEHDERD